jgi:hypothetical protein
MIDPQGDIINRRNHAIPLGQPTQINRRQSMPPGNLSSDLRPSLVYQ